LASESVSTLLPGSRAAAQRSRRRRSPRSGRGRSRRRGMRRRDAAAVSDGRKAVAWPCARSPRRPGRPRCRVVRLARSCSPWVGTPVRRVPWLVTSPPPFRNGARRRRNATVALVPQGWRSGSRGPERGSGGRTGPGSRSPLSPRDTRRSAPGEVVRAGGSAEADPGVGIQEVGDVADRSVRASTEQLPVTDCTATTGQAPLTSAICTDAVPETPRSTTWLSTRQ